MDGWEDDELAVTQLVGMTDDSSFKRRDNRRRHWRIGWVKFSMHQDGRRLEVHDLERNDQDSTTRRLLLSSKDSGMRLFETLLHG